MGKLYFDTNSFMNFLFALLICIISGLLLIFPPEDFNELAKDICGCSLGISSLATIYTGWQLYRTRTKV